MPDNLKVAKPESEEWINIHEPYELRDWAIYFSVSREKLKETVMAVGPMFEDVKRQLGK
ncbi:DUF3606 domain-containing protein [Geothrix oryzisoli]|uniref:DUF3606 domain-containing protein n=1 Tax=Geothrix oryzisoli TaxID=2922721 RepID=UPI001FACD844|nr:DUF3606 domain-containing protein [Geothrix oryzisoli]